MVNSIVKQSIEICLRFNPLPKITSSAEICTLCGMLCKIFNLNIPDVNTTGELKDYVLSHINRSNDDRVNKFVELLSESQKESEQITEEWREVMQYGYDNE